MIDFPIPETDLAAQCGHAESVWAGWESTLASYIEGTRRCQAMVAYWRNRQAELAAELAGGAAVETQTTFTSDPLENQCIPNQ